MVWSQTFFEVVNLTIGKLLRPGLLTRLSTSTKLKGPDNGLEFSWTVPLPGIVKPCEKLLWFLRLCNWMTWTKAAGLIYYRFICWWFEVWSHPERCCVWAMQCNMCQALWDFGPYGWRLTSTRPTRLMAKRVGSSSLHEPVTPFFWTMWSLSGTGSWSVFRLAIRGPPCEMVFLKGSWIALLLWTIHDVSGASGILERRLGWLRPGPLDRQSFKKNEFIQVHAGT